MDALGLTIQWVASSRRDRTTNAGAIAGNVQATVVPQYLLHQDAAVIGFNHISATALPMPEEAPVTSPTFFLRMSISV
jgi:hypothetical protein